MLCAGEQMQNKIVAIYPRLSGNGVCRLPNELTVAYDFDLPAMSNVISPFGGCAV